MPSPVSRSNAKAKETFLSYGVFADVDQRTASTDVRRESFAVTVAAPQEWDGIGQALRSAFRDHRDPPCDMAETLHRLDRVD